MSRTRPKMGENLTLVFCNFPISGSGARCGVKP
jgi:hypothetical protein